MLRFTLSLLLAALSAACSSAPPWAARADGQDEIAARVRAAAPSEGRLLTPWLAAERARIEAERTAAARRFDAAERDCWRRFAVTGCIDAARAERRAALDPLRQEDLALNAIERQRRTGARLRELQDKQDDAK
jgi:hypothetical protein